MASILPPSAGIHHEWMTSQSGAVTVSRTGSPDRDAQPVDRDRAVRVGELPEELLAARPSTSSRPAAAFALGHVLDPGQLDEDERRHGDEDQRRGPSSTSARAAWSRGSAALGVARAPAAPVADDERDEQPFDADEDEERRSR